MNATHPAAQLLQTLFEEAPQQLYLEIRPLAPGQGARSPRRRFFQLQELQQQGFDLAVPEGLDGKANVYFGALPRRRQGGTAGDVALATCLWADLDRGLPVPWPEAVPSPSVLVETSPGKFQSYWLLREPSGNLCGIEDLVMRLAAALGGDRAATDRARVLRLPGFRNLKYPEQPVARLVYLNPQRRYTLAELETVLPPTSSERQAPTGGARPRNAGGAFDPHQGDEDVPAVVRQELAEELRRRGALLYHDGRLAGPCPFPGHTGQTLHNFYFSPISGRWWCFGEHHRGRRGDKVCVAGGAWSLWAALFPGRATPRPSESSTNPPKELLGGFASNSPLRPYSRPAPANLEAWRDAPARSRTAALLRAVGALKKADAEETCGVPLKGRCTANKEHGVVREGRATGKTPWCSGCHTETSARYLRVQLPGGSYSVLRLQRRLAQLPYDAAEVEPGLWEMDPDHAALLQGAIENEYVAATDHFRRVQRRYEHELLAWHFAVGEDQEGLWVELHVLARRSERLPKALYELTGGTRKAALFVPDVVVRYDYGANEGEQLRREWAGLLKTALLGLENDCLFRPIYEALNGRHLSQAYGDLRDAYEKAGEAAANGQGEDVTCCPIVDEEGKVCGAKLRFFLDPDNQYPLNPLVYPKAKSLARAWPSPG